ncbi:ABC transporter ATP-binding protein [Pleionea sediminis]|uniref:ABC transporter ATP-binding protein n=1 Tax=Pleionea sediminis TaxID=2569479 RepID=UPI001186CCC1|nr:ABC transporter ATP-binding protein [Pleionea sediminis]
MKLLHIENLSVEFPTHKGPVTVLDKVSLRMERGEVLGIVGESGSGKSMLALAIMGLLAPNASLKADYLSLNNQDLMKLTEEQRKLFVAQNASIIFQEPQTSMNPCFTIGRQLMETIELHGIRRPKKQKQRARELLDAVGINEPELRLKQYPHQLSGGMNQRVMIAMAIAAEPKLLIADEPTTALDVTIQSQIIELLLELNRSREMGLMLITHDFALMSESTQRVCVMYSGQIMENAPTESILENPRHPYSRALLDSIPHIGERHHMGQRLYSLKGTIPAIDHLPVGCRLGPRCPKAAKECVKPPRLEKIDQHGLVRCHFPLEKENQSEGSSQ